MPSYQAVATVQAGTGPVGVAVTPDGKHAYVANYGSSTGTILVIGTATYKVVAAVPVGIQPYAVAFTPDGKHALSRIWAPTLFL